MRIEQISTTKNIPERSYERTLTQGEVLVAEVTAVMEDAVALKSAGGGALTARLIGEIGVAVGDYVETVVDEADGGRYVLRIVDITRGGGQRDAQAGVQNNRAAAAAHALLDTLSMLKMNPGADPKSAAFLARHGIAGTGNLETLAQLAKGAEPVGRILAEIMSMLGDTAQAAKSNETGQAARPAAHIHAQPATQAQPPADQAVKAPVSEIQNTQQAAQTTEAGAQAAQSTAAPDAQTAAAPQGAAPKNGVQNAQQQLPADSPMLPQSPNAAAEAQQGAPLAKTAAGLMPHAEIQPADAKTTPEAQHIYIGKHQGPANLHGQKNAADTGEAVRAAQELIVQKAAALFVKTTDRQGLATAIKKAVKELPEELKELKLLLERNDIKNKDTAVQKLEPAEKQLSLMSQIKRFDCFHVPLMQNGNTATTAELYVYRYRNKKASRGDEDTVILLGLDTQHMGRVETLVRAAGKTLDIGFNVEDMRLSDAFTEAAAQLKDAAERLGYRQVTVSAKQLAKRTTLFDAEEKLTAYADGSAANVDIRI